MEQEPGRWLEPEQALSRFIRPDIALFRQEESEKAAASQRFGFMLGNVGILIPENTLSEVMRSFRVFPVPNTKEWMQGLANLRGNLIPVYDMALLLGLSDKPMEHNNLLVLEKGPKSVGLLIDNLPKSRDISQWHPLMHTPRLPAGLTEFVTEVYAVQEIIWLCFDHRAFFEFIKSSISK